MSSALWLIYILFLILEVFAMAFFMEVYKKNIRKNKSKAWENWIVGGVLSLLCVALLHFSGMMYPLFNKLFHAKLWLDYIFYTILFFIGQWKADMLVIKRAVKSLLTQWIKDNAKLNDSQIEEVLKLLGL